MRVLVACERSGRVRSAFRRRGHDAWSCDLVPADDGSEHHIVGDATRLLDDGWDLLIAHPPCDQLSILRSPCFARACGHQSCSPPLLADQAIEAARLFWRFRSAPVPRVAVENTRHHPLAARLCGPPTFIAQPWHHGDAWTKATCWWLTGLPPLIATAPVHPIGSWISGQGSGRAVHPDAPDRVGDDRAVLRALTPVGMAEAMVDQWGHPAPSPTLF